MSNHNYDDFDTQIQADEFSDQYYEEIAEDFRAMWQEREGRVVVGDWDNSREEDEIRDESEDLDADWESDDWGSDRDLFSRDEFIQYGDDE